MITKKEFDLLYDENVTKKQYDLIIKKIDERFEEICEKFLRRKRDGWYVYDNYDYGVEGSAGSFDPTEYREDIFIDGENIDPPPGYDLSFPTRWLWESGWEKEMKETSKIYKKEEEAKKKAIKINKESKQQQVELLKASIKSKLTPAELKLVKFK